MSVVVCARNEASRLAACLETVAAERPDEIVVVDGGSTDETPAIARRFTERVVSTSASNLTRDRQIGIDAARNDLVALVDADHRLAPGTLAGLWSDLVTYDLDIVQAGLTSQAETFLCAAEADAWALVHNRPGPRAMIGVAPALFRRRVFEAVRFDDDVTSTIDDTDFMYRLARHGGFRVGIGRTVVAQEHFGDLRSYLRKFRWYGKGDGEFCRKHPERAPSMLYHLAVRYPLVYPVRALAGGRPRAVPFFVLQGTTRLASALWTLTGGAAR